MTKIPTPEEPARVVWIDVTKIRAIVIERREDGNGGWFEITVGEDPIVIGYQTAAQRQRIARALGIK